MNEQCKEVVSTEKIVNVITRLGDVTRTYKVESFLTVGESNGVVYRIVAMTSEAAHRMGCERGPAWAQCVKTVEDAS